MLLVGPVRKVETKSIGPGLDQSHESPLLGRRRTDGREDLGAPHGRATTRSSKGEGG